MMNPSHLREIYHNVKAKFHEINACLANQEGEYFKKQVLSLENVQKDLDSKLDSLNQDAEWDIFTIAFYGETNAGKSTLIEALRIYFGEKTKMDSWNEFKNIYEPFIKQKENLEQNIHEQEQAIDELSKYILEQMLLEQHKRKSLWYRFFSFFSTHSLAKQIKNLEKELDNKKSLYNQTQESLQTLLNRLLRLSDGNIIGDGRSDFTHEVTSYIFSINNQNFQILDVPGIEGDEIQVNNSILSATRKAHCVFYITRAPTPPQKGDDNKKGTLEKIKEHLGAQTEVYSIFNKSITNTQRLEQALVNEGEKQSLQVLDEKMQEALGEHYVGRKELSAKVAFLALAECLFAESKKREREKFLSKYDSITLLQKSGFGEFADFIVRDLVKDTQGKIKKSHYNRANAILCGLQGLLTKISATYEKLLSDAKNEVDDTKNNLEHIKTQNLKAISNKIDECIEEFKINIRKYTYKLIDSDVSDKEFERLQKDIQEELDNLKRRISYMIQDFNYNLQIDFGHDISMDMKSGIDTVGIHFTLANSWNPVGWTAAALMGIAMLIGLGKSIYKFFSSDYKKSEQKRVANKNLERISENIKENTEKELEKLRRNVNEYMQTLQQECETVTEHIREPYIFICRIQKEVKQLTYQIQREGELP